MDPARIFPLVIPLIVVGVVALRARRAVPLHPDRLWIAPLLAAIGIGLGLYYTPHPLFGPGDYAAMAVAAAVGLGFGWWRAHATVMHHDADTGRVMTRQSNLAVGVLAAVIAVRVGARQVFGEALGPSAAVVTDASMLFAL